MTEKSDIEKLQILISHWIDHNHNHETEMAKWQDLADQQGQSEAATHIGKAISGMQETDKELKKALKILGGKIENHHHHHHH